MVQTHHNRACVVYTCRLYAIIFFRVRVSTPMDYEPLQIVKRTLDG